MKKILLFLIVLGFVIINCQAQLLAPRGIKMGIPLVLVTSTAAELNKLHGATINTAELNILDGALATFAEINHLVGVTSPIQTQLNTKAPIISPAFTGIMKLNTDTVATQAYARAEGGGGGTDTTHLSNRINLKANTASPTFTGTVVGITKAMVGLSNVTNESKATMFTTPTFTGTVSGISATMVSLGNVTNESKSTMFTTPTFTGHPTIEGITSTGATGTGNFVFSISPTLSGTVALGSGSLTLTGSIGATAARITKGWFTDLESTNRPTFNGTGLMSVGDTSTMLSKYARKLSPTFTGTVSLPSTTSIGTISSTEIGYVDGVTSAIQTQFNNTVSASTVSIPYVAPGTAGNVLTSSAGSWVSAASTGGSGFDSTYVYAKIDSLENVVSNQGNEIAALWDAIDALGVGDLTPPHYVSSEVGTWSDDTIHVVFDEALDGASVPATTDFVLTDNGTPATINSVSIGTDTVFLKLNTAATGGHTYLLDYTKGANPLHDDDDNEVVNWTDRTVTNNLTPGGLLAGLVAYWKLDETSGQNFADLVHANTAVGYNVTPNGTGKIGKAVTYDAVTDAMTVAPDADLIIGGDEMSVSFWFKVDILPSTAARSYYLFNGTGTSYYPWQILINSANDFLAFYVDNNTGTTFLSSCPDSQFSVATWYHIVCVLDGGTSQKIYIDGTDKTAYTSASFTGTLAPQNSKLNIGNSYDLGDGSDAIDGMMDEILIYNRALTQQEINDLFALTQPE